MAETKSDPKPSDPQTQPPPPPPPSSATTTTTTTAARSSKKRKLDNVDTHRKLRALVKSLRPHFIDVLRTPDFRNSQAAHEIRKKLKRAMDAYKQMKPETASAEMPKKQSEGQSLPGEPKDGQQNIEEKQAKRHQSERVPEKSPEPPLDVKAEDSKLPESYVVGGSNLGWNFILFSGASTTKAVYYGVTKESHLISRAKKSDASK